MPIKQSVFCLAASAGLAGYFHTMYKDPLLPSEFKSFEFCLHFLEVGIVKIIFFVVSSNSYGILQSFF